MFLQVISDLALTHVLYFQLYYFIIYFCHKVPHETITVQITFQYGAGQLLVLYCESQQPTGP